MSRMNLFIPIHKVDEETRTVYGIATAEKRDLSGEVCDYASTKPYYEQWSQKFSDATNGKSLGNVRAMHGKIAAGKVTSINFDDAGKRIEIAAKIVDDAEWEKVREGVYTGFSQGGKYIKRWNDEGSDVTRYTADPHEVSLVDLPCLPDARFQVIGKAGGTEERAFKTVIEEPSAEQVQARAMAMAKGQGGAWREYLEPAINALVNDAMKAAAKEKMKPVDPPLEAEVDEGSSAQDEDNEVDGTTETEAANDHPPRKSPEAEAATTTRTSKIFEPAQVWAAGENGPFFARKADAVKFMKAAEAEAAAKASASPLKNALDRVEAALKAAEGDKIAHVVEALFPSVAKRQFTADERKAAAKAGEAMPDGGFPIKDKSDLDNAVRAYGRAKDKEAAKKHIEARAKALGCESCLPDTWGDAAKMTAGRLAKGLYGVSDFAQLIAQLSSAYQSALNERAYEGDDSKVPDDLCHLLRSAGEILLRMAAEEVGELMPDGAEPSAEGADEMAMGAGLGLAGEIALGKLAELGAPFAALAKFKAQPEPIETIFASLEKKGARNSKADGARIQAIHDHCVGLGCGCSASNVGKDATDGDDLAKALDKNAALEKEIANNAARFEGLAKRIAHLEAQPMPAKAAITVVPKGAAASEAASETAAPADVLKAAGEAIAKLPKAERDLALMKLALANPIHLR